MPHLNMTPSPKGETLIYEYLYNKLAGKVKINNLPVPVVFEDSAVQTKDKQITLVLLGYDKKSHKFRETRDVRIVDNVGGTTYRVGEPLKLDWLIVAKAPKREEVNSMLSAIYSLLGNSGAVDQPYRIEHYRLQRMDKSPIRYSPDNNTTQLSFVGGRAYSVYMRTPPYVEDKTATDLAVKNFDVKIEREVKP